MDFRNHSNRKSCTLTETKFIQINIYVVLLVIVSKPEKKPMCKYENMLYGYVYFNDFDFHHLKPFHTNTTMRSDAHRHKIRCNR